MATTTRSTEELVRAGFDALNDRNRKAFVELHSDDAVLHVGDEDIRGITEIAEEEFAYFEAFPDLTLSPETILDAGDAVAARWTVAGTHDGPFEGIEPTGEAVEVTAMGIFRVEDGTIAEVWIEADRLGLVQQLGAVDTMTG